MSDVCLTVDLEPDCPPYLDGWVGVERGMPQVLDLFAANDLLATVFATGETAERYPELIRRIVDAGHELGCHAHTHRSFSALEPDEAEREIARSAALLRAFAPVTSFRAPYLDFPERYMTFLEAHGFTIDASRGRYKPTHWFRTPARSPIRRIPASTTSSVLRAPPAVRNLLLGLMRTPVVLFVHPWEFVDQSEAPIPWDCRFGTGTAALESLSSTIEFFARRGDRFVRMTDLEAVDP
ncbi:MAG: polysaccharide deacetylase family protein [Gemmatimonadetes bacterium]|nr:polysaccharide deacetylase family protein [Gemmatimonadota bacterium]